MSFWFFGSDPGSYFLWRIYTTFFFLIEILALLILLVFEVLWTWTKSLFTTVSTAFQYIWIRDVGGYFLILSLMVPSTFQQQTIILLHF